MASYNNTWPILPETAPQVSAKMSSTEQHLTASLKSVVEREGKHCQESKGSRMKDFFLKRVFFFNNVDVKCELAYSSREASRGQQSLQNWSYMCL